MGFEGRDVQCGHEIIRHHHAHHVANRIRRKDPRDGESTSHFECQGRLANTARPAEQQDEWPVVFVLEEPPCVVAACARFAPSPLKNPAGKAPDRITGHAAFASIAELAFDLDDDLKGQPRLDAGREK